MPLEIEAKFRLRDANALRQKLLQLGAQPKGLVLEHNTYFDTAKRSLRAADEGLRIRELIADHGARKIVLTYKSARAPGELKVRQEEEMPVGSAEAAAGVLAGLGYQPFLFFHKRRESYVLDGAKIELDELPELGSFLEIEADSAETVQAIRGRLGLANEPVVQSPYIALIDQHLARGEGTGPTKLVFP
jgi:adenylate cyclase class 2